MRFKSGSTGNGDGTETQGRKSLRERAIELATKYVVRPARRTLVLGAASYGLWRSRPLAPLSGQAVSMRVKGLDDRMRRGQEPAILGRVGVITRFVKQYLKIREVATNASITRVGTEDIVKVGLEDGRTIKAVVKAGSIRAIYTRDGSVNKEIKENEVASFLCGKTITGVATMPGSSGAGGRGRPTDLQVDQIIFQASTGKSIIIEVEPGSIISVGIIDSHPKNSN